MAARNAASVLPEPVGASSSVERAGEDRRPALRLRGGRRGESRAEPRLGGGVEAVERIGCGGASLCHRRRFRGLWSRSRGASSVRLSPRGPSLRGPPTMQEPSLTGEPDATARSGRGHRDGTARRARPLWRMATALRAPPARGRLSRGSRLPRRFDGCQAARLLGVIRSRAQLAAASPRSGGRCHGDRRRLQGTPGHGSDAWRKGAQKKKTCAWLAPCAGSKKIPAASYSPTRLPWQYHRLQEA